jgi:hypothetical protein
MNLTEEHKELIRTARDEILHRVKSQKAISARIPFESGNPEMDKDYLLKSIQSIGREIETHDDYKNLRNELFRLAGWLFAAGGTISDCRFVFNQLAELFNRTNSSLSDYELYFVLKLFGYSESLDLSEDEEDNLKTRILKNILLNKRSEIITPELLLGDLSIWMSCYKAFLNKSKDELDASFNDLCQAWMEDGNYNFFTIHIKYIFFLEILPNALLYVVQNSLNWKHTCLDSESKNFYLLANFMNKY